MYEEKITEKILERDWTFHEIANLKDTLYNLSVEISNELTLLEKFELVRERKVTKGYVGFRFESFFRENVKFALKEKIAETVNNMLKEATVNFGGNTNEISERSMGGEPHKKRSTDEKKDSMDEE